MLPSEDVAKSIASLTEQASRIKVLASSIFTIDLQGAIHFEVQSPAIHFVKAIANAASSGTIDFRPRLEVSVEANSPAIVFDGKTTMVELVPALIIHNLMEARGDWRSRRDLRTKSPMLAEENRLDRYIKKLIETLGIPIQGGKRGYRISTDLYLPPESVASPFEQFQSERTDRIIRMRPPREGESGFQVVKE